MSSIALKSAEIIAGGLAEGVETCRAIIVKLKENKTDTAEDDEIATNELDMGIKQMEIELKALSQFDESEDLVQKVGEYVSLKWEAQKVLNEVKVRLTLAHQSSSTNAQPVQTHSSTSVFSRLPEMIITKFDGNLLYWSEFWEQFNSNVDVRQDMNDAIKLTYLKSFLEGEAKDTIGGLQNTAENYKIALDKLRNRYARPKRILDCHYAALENLTPATSNIEQCRSVLNQIEIHMGILKSLGEDTNHNNFRITLMKKFPTEILHDLRLWMSTKEDHTVDELRFYLQQVIEAREESAHLTKIGTQNPSQSHFTTETLYAGQSKPGQDSASTSQAGTKRQTNRSHQKAQSGKAQKRSSDSRKSDGRKTQSSSGPPNKVRRRYQCRFCKESHHNDECTKLTTIEQRKQWVRDNKLCFQCLSSKHMSPSCDNKRACAHCKEFGKHNRCLCPSLENKIKDDPSTTNTMFSSTQTSTILQTAMVDVMSREGKRIPCRVLFDTGSERSYITAKTERLIKPAHKEQTMLTIYTFGNRKPMTKDTALVSLSIRTKERDLEVIAYIIPDATGNIASFPQEKRQIARQYPNIQLAKDVEDDRPVDIIIGNDFYYSFLTGEVKQIAGRLFLLHSKFGWILSGCPNQSSSTSDSLSMLTYVQHIRSANQGVSLPDPALQDDKIRDLWELETIGITDSPKALRDDEAIHQFNSTTQFKDGRYFVMWPWAQYPPELPINLGLALGRLRGLLKRIDKNKLALYDAVLQDQKDKGIIEHIDNNELPKTHPVHYLSHHCVIQEGKTTKLRIVYDASAKTRGQHSLNDFLYKGPLMLEELTALLLRFRTHRIGLIADIEKAFLQLGLQEADRDVTRFLWLKDISKGPTDDNIIHLRFCRVPFGVISSPFLLAATINFHLCKQESPLCTQIARSLYVDNLVTGAETVKQAITLFKEARTNFQTLSMNIREWSSSDDTFMSHIPEQLRNNKENVSVLGLQWNRSKDMLRLAVKPATIQQAVRTKRQALSVIASVYDPCGLISPLTLSTKLFLQSLWVKKVKWDDRLTSSQEEEWALCAKCLSTITNVEVPRYLNIPENHEVELHCFTDASNHCYSAVIYMRSVVNGEAIISMVMSRSRLTPLRKKDNVTIPKLELLAVLIGIRLIKYVTKTLDLHWSNTTLWTDSQIVLGWLRSDRLLHPFVSRRVEEIRKSAHVHFRYVPSSMNPADIATRPLDHQSSLPSMWMAGPKFLKRHQQEWPNTPDALEVTTLSSADDPNNESMPKTVLANVVVTSDTSDLPQYGIILPVPLVCRLQRTHFPQETNKMITPLSKSLGLFMDSDGVLRCKGRYGNAVMPYDQKYPILLPTDSDVTIAIVQRIHEGNNHIGISHTLSLVREHYWIPKGRRVVSKILKRCAPCAKYGGGPYKLPPMPDLPQERITYSPPFTFTGLDYLGPLMVSKNGRPHKQWICLYTCLAVRAIHLEVVNDLTAEQFTMALRRFVAMRGVPDFIISDNAAQFKMTANILNSLPSSAKQIEWKFIPALSPWQGGFYERLVGLVKHCLTRSLDRSLLNGSQLQTVVKEIEAVLNTRPLTSVGSDIEQVLTPSNFLTTSGTALLEPPLNRQATSTIQTQLIMGWKRTQKFLEEFRKMFLNQYLVGLRERHQVDHKQSRIISPRHPAVGDVVQLKGDHKNRAHWQVGKIISLLQSSDGQPRTAMVKLTNGHVLNRSIAQLYPLEIEDFHALHSNPPLPYTPSPDTPLEDHPQQSDEAEPGTPQPATPEASQHMAPPSSDAPAGHRQPRPAAIQARNRIREWVASLFAAAVVQST